MPSFKKSLKFSVLFHIIVVAIFATSFSSSTKIVFPKMAASKGSEKSKQPKDKIIIKAGLVNKELLANAIARQKKSKERTAANLKEQQRKIKRADQHLVKRNKEMKRLAKELDLSKQNANKYKKDKDDLAKEIAKHKKILKDEETKVSSIKQEKEKLEKEIANKLEQAKLEQKQEQEAKRQSWLESEYSRVVTMIQTSVIEKRNMVSAFSDDLSCQVQFKLLKGGHVVNVEVVKSSGNLAYDDNAKMAVYKAAPFDIPDDGELLNKLRDIVLVFTRDIDNA